MLSVTIDEENVYEYFIEWEYDNMPQRKERHSIVA